MPLRRNMSHRAKVSELMSSYHKTGKIGNVKPKNESHALEIANAIAYRMERGKRRKNDKS